MTIGPKVRSVRVPTMIDPPPLKWSVPRYGFEPEEDRDGEEGAQARGGRGQAAAGGCPGLAGAVRGGGDPGDRGDGGHLLSLAAGVRRPEVGPGEAAEGAGGGECAAAQGGGGPDAWTSRSWRRPHGETSRPRAPARLCRAHRAHDGGFRAPHLCGARPAPLDAAQGAAGPRRRRAAHRRHHRAGAAVWPLRLPQGHGPAAGCRLAGERQAGGADLAARGAEGAAAAAEARAAVAGRRLLRPAAAGAAEPRLELRLRRGPHP